MVQVVVHLPSGKEIDLGQLSEETTFAQVRTAIEEEAALTCNRFKLVLGVDECADHDAIGDCAAGSHLDLSVVVTSRDPRVLREPNNPTGLMRLLKAFRSYDLWVLGNYNGDGDLHAVFDPLCSTPEKQVFTTRFGGCEHQAYLWRLPLDAEILKSVVPWQKTFGLDPLEIEAVLSLVADFAGFLDVRDGGGRLNAVVALANGDLVAMRASWDEHCGFLIGSSDLVKTAMVRANSLEELKQKAGGFLRALQGESVGEWELHFGGLQFAFEDDSGIPLEFWRKQPYRSCIELEVDNSVGVGAMPSSPLLKHRLELPKLLRWAITLLKWAITANWKGAKVNSKAWLGGRTMMSCEDWMREFGEEAQRELVKEFLKHVKATRLVIKLAEQQASGGKIDKLQVDKLNKKLSTLNQCADVAVYVEEGSDLWNKGKDVMENAEMRELMANGRNCL